MRKKLKYLLALAAVGSTCLLCLWCVKAGQGHFAHLLRMMPERYKWHEEQERELRKTVGDFGILRDRTGGTTKTLTLEDFRKRIESQQEFDAYDWGGCGCAIATEAKMPNGAGEPSLPDRKL